LPLYVEQASGVTRDGRWVMIDGHLISLETLLPRARGIGLLPVSGEGLTHAGWVKLDASFSPLGPAPARWREAAMAAAGVTESAGGGVLCVRRGDRALAGWSRGTDRSLLDVELPAGSGFYWMVAHAEGCAVLVESEETAEVRLYGPGGAARTLIAGARALGPDGEGLVVATASEIVRFDRSLRETARYRGVADVSVVAGLDDGAVLVGAQGNAAGIARAGAPPRLHFEDVPGEVVQILPGPRGTAVAGTASGHVGFWSVETGRRLDVARLGGPIERLAVVDRVVHALSARGEWLALDLSVYERPYCDLLRDVRGRVPVVWENGEARRAPPGEGCAGRK
jgi:hypothetical protein